MKYSGNGARSDEAKRHHQMVVDDLAETTVKYLATHIKLSEREKS